MARRGPGVRGGRRKLGRAGGGGGVAEANGAGAAPSVWRRGVGGGRLARGGFFRRALAALQDAIEFKCEVDVVEDYDRCYAEEAELIANNSHRRKSM